MCFGSYPLSKNRIYTLYKIDKELLLRRRVWTENKSMHGRFKAPVSKRL